MRKLTYYKKKQTHLFNLIFSPFNTPPAEVIQGALTHMTLELARAQITDTAYEVRFFHSQKITILIKCVLN